tara:strand:- start:131 stop:559 length:429 start_codon:yes stop_codon:yes gene_type:complete
MTLDPLVVELLAKQNKSYAEIASSLNCNYNTLWHFAKKHNIKIKSISGGARVGSGSVNEFKQEWREYMMLRLFDDCGNPLPVKETGAIQKAFYNEMCWYFEDDDFENKCKKTKLYHVFTKMKKDIKNGIIKFNPSNDIDWNE